MELALKYQARILKIEETYYEEKPNNGQELKIWHEQ